MEPDTSTQQAQTLENQPVASVEPNPSKKNYRMHLAVVACLLALVALGYFLYTKTTVEVAALVNGSKITQAEVDENIAMMTKSAELQGIDVTDPTIVAEIEKQALDNLINNELLLGAAEKSGMSANEAAIQSAYDTLVNEVGGEDALKSRMETVGLTSDTLMGNISDRIVVDQYIESVTDIENATVTDEEVDTYLSSISTEGVTLPPLEEIKPQIEASILAQKQQTIVDELLAKLRSEASIEITE